MKVKVLLISTMLAVFGLFSANPAMAGSDEGCCVGTTGNIDCDPLESVDMGDLTVLIDHLFLSLTPVCCYEEADISPGGAVIDMADLTVLIDHLFIGLNPLPDCPATGTPSCEMMGVGDCKTFSGSKDEIPPDQGCIEYQYGNDGRLVLTHVNAGFNCCPVLDFEFTVSEGVITIEEIELEDLCDCLCLFDLTFEISDLPPGTYQINIIEPYIQGTAQDPLMFEADLSSAGSGSYCVDRHGYPWAE